MQDYISPDPYQQPIFHSAATRPFPVFQEVRQNLEGLSLPCPPLPDKVIKLLSEKKKKLLFSAPPKFSLHVSIRHSEQRPNFWHLYVEVGQKCQAGFN